MAQQNLKWWSLDEKDIASSVFSLVSKLYNEQQSRILMDKRHLGLYADCPELEYLGLARQRMMGRTQRDPSYNIILSMCDTITAKITKNRPLPRFLPNGSSDWSSYLKTKNLQKFIEGQFLGTNLYEKTASCFLDSAIFGTGIIRLKINSNHEIELARVLPFDLIFDDAETITGEPQQSHERKFIHREVLLKKFPQFKKEINQAGASQALWFKLKDLKDMVEVIESFKLPTSADSNDGKHTISISNCCLYNSSYEENFLPYSFLRWNVRPVGFWGQGIPEQAKSYQRTLEKTVYTVERCMEASVPRVLIAAGSKVSPAAITPELGNIILYTGLKPEITAQNLVPPNLENHIENIYKRAYEILGIGQLGAMNKPGAKRVDSSQALQTLTEIETERFAHTELRWEAFHVNIAKIMVSLMRRLAKETNNFKTIEAPGEHFLKQIEWKKMDLTEDQYSIQVYSQSDFPKTPAGRIETINSLIALGMPRQEALRSLGMPDPAGYTDWENADMDDIDATIQKFVDGESYERPEPLQNLELGIKRFKKAYLFYKNKKAPDEVLESLRLWIVDATGMLTLSAPPEAPQDAQGAPNSSGDVRKPNDLGSFIEQMPNEDPIQ